MEDAYVVFLTCYSIFTMLIIISSVKVMAVGVLVTGLFAFDYVKYLKKLKQPEIETVITNKYMDNSHRKWFVVDELKITLGVNDDSYKRYNINDKIHLIKYKGKLDIKHDTIMEKNKKLTLLTIFNTLMSLWIALEISSLGSWNAKPTDLFGVDAMSLILWIPIWGGSLYVLIIWCLCMYNYIPGFKENSRILKLYGRIQAPISNKYKKADEFYLVINDLKTVINVCDSTFYKFDINENVNIIDGNGIFYMEEDIAIKRYDDLMGIIKICGLIIILAIIIIFALCCPIKVL